IPFGGLAVLDAQRQSPTFGGDHSAFRRIRRNSPPFSPTHGTDCRPSPRPADTRGGTAPGPETPLGRRRGGPRNSNPEAKKPQNERHPSPSRAHIGGKGRATAAR